MDIHESGEMYLETILTLKNKNQYVRSIDIANALNYSKPSVSRGMKILKEANYITIDDKGYIEFTDEGYKLAEEVYNRHQALTQFLVLIGVDKEQAENDACRIEHVISKETYYCIANFVKKQS
jgi:Mn-dependent DtxR family transcriptional regulator